MKEWITFAFNIWAQWKLVGLIKALLFEQLFQEGCRWADGGTDATRGFHGRSEPCLNFYVNQVQNFHLAWISYDYINEYNDNNIETILNNNKNTWKLREKSKAEKTEEFTRIENKKLYENFSSEKEKSEWWER